MRNKGLARRAVPRHGDCTGPPRHKSGIGPFIATSPESVRAIAIELALRAERVTITCPLACLHLDFDPRPCIIPDLAGLPWALNWGARPRAALAHPGRPMHLVRESSIGRGDRASASSLTAYMAVTWNGVFDHGPARWCVRHGDGTPKAVLDMTEFLPDNSAPHVCGALLASARRRAGRKPPLGIPPVAATTARNAAR